MSPDQSSATASPVAGKRSSAARGVERPGEGALAETTLASKNCLRPRFQPLGCIQRFPRIKFCNCPRYHMQQIAGGTQPRRPEDRAIGVGLQKGRGWRASSIGAGGVTPWLSSIRPSSISMFAISPSTGGVNSAPPQVDPARALAARQDPGVRFVQVDGSEDARPAYTSRAMRNEFKRKSAPRPSQPTHPLPTRAFFAPPPRHGQRDRFSTSETSGTWRAKKYFGLLPGQIDGQIPVVCQKWKSQHLV